MSSPRRKIPRRPANSPPSDPTGPATVVISQGTTTKTPNRRPRPHPGNSATSTSSASSSSDNDTIFDGSSSRSGTPSSPFTPLKPSPKSPSGLLFSDEVDNRTSGKALAEPPPDHEAPERRLYKIPSEVDEPFPYTPSKKSGQPSSTWRNLPSTERPPLRRQAHIDDVLQHQQKSESSRIPGTFDSHAPEAEMAIDYSGSSPTPSSTNHRQKILSFVPWKTKKNPRQINNSIHECIRKRIRPTKEPVEPSANKRETGYIYVFESPRNAPGHVKIGKCKGEPQKRREKWEECGITLIEAEDSDRNAFEHFSIVESLIKAELHNKRRTYECKHHNKPVKHEEWYEIDKKTALDSVSRWRQWLKYKTPFDKGGFLTPYWHWRVQKLPKSIDNVDWDRWTRPSSWDYLDFQFEQFGDGHYAQIKAHLCRKDLQFCLTGGMMVFISYTQFGLAGALWGLLALLVL